MQSLSFCHPVANVWFKVQYHLIRLREQDKYNNAADVMGDALWFRDFRYLKAQSDLMIEMYEAMANAYSHFYELHTYNQKVRKMIEQKKKDVRVCTRLHCIIRFITSIAPANVEF